MIITKDTPPELVEARKADAKELVQLEENLHEINTKLKRMKSGTTIKELNSYLHEGSLRSIWSMVTRSSKSLLSLMNSNSGRMRGKTTLDKLDLMNENIKILTAVVIRQSKDSKALNELAMMEYE